MDIVFATRNNGKLKEICEIMSAPNDLFNIISAEQAGILHDVTEDGATFEENAIKKAAEIMRLSGKITLADDSGLEIDFLDKAPGVYSARYLGEDTPYDVKNRYILDLMKSTKGQERSARFVCVIAAAVPVYENGVLKEYETLTARGVIEGVISEEIRGVNGFGYDPIFYIPEFGMTTAQMPSELKNQISHRGKALEIMKELLVGYFK